MATIETKKQLIDYLLASRAALEKVIARSEPQAMLRPGICGEWSGKDVLAHVAHWQEMHLGWWEAVQRGEEPEVPAPGITWKREDVDRLNQQIYLAHCDQPLEEVLVILRKTFERFMEVVEATPEADLFQPGLVSFTGKGTLARWYVEFAHHDGFGRNKIYNGLVRKKRVLLTAENR